MEEKLEQFMGLVSEKLDKFERKLNNGLAKVHSSPVDENPCGLSVDPSSFVSTRDSHGFVAPGTGFSTASGRPTSRGNFQR
ncbi:hypothetical protein DPMN_126486 [Dreissena polymorpha]|uniref:Uncharacterized protein n=1 Tax=Dreissena polymorpha TaxID=45954 RepID=A0A9D4GX72_DREPO|nr:hypothetical protein DPMN_126486 [Dreissena polymorpha]